MNILIFVIVNALAGITSIFHQEPALTVTSISFKNDEMIPSRFTCDGANINPAITVSNIPRQAKSIAMIVEDPDAPNGGFCHWLIWNIELIWDMDPVEVIKENGAPGLQGKNSAGKDKYTGPCSPSGTHHYHFQVYAVDTMLDLKKGASKSQLENALKGHILATGELIGLYKKAK